MLEEICPNKDSLNLFLAGETSALQRDEIESHLAGCADCRRDLSAIFSESINNSQNFKAPESLVEKVKTLPNKDLHAELEDNTSTQTAQVPWYRQNFFQIAFAASLLVFIGFYGFYYWQFQQTSNTDDIFRNGTSNRNSIQLITPQNNLDISTEKIEFSWSKINDAKNYTLILSDEKGDIFKEIKTEKLNIETTVFDLGLTEGKHYFWQIRAKLSDGSTSESETRKFSNKN
jgi:hypothetical protein